VQPAGADNDNVKPKASSGVKIRPLGSGYPLPCRLCGMGRIISSQAKSVEEFAAIYKRLRLFEER